MGWKAWARGGVEVREVPGDHSTMLHRPNVTKLAAHLRQAIDIAEAGRG